MEQNLNPFAALRGALTESQVDVDYRRRMAQGETAGVDMARGPSPAPRAGGRKISKRDYRRPLDLTRSRSVGLSARLCGQCLAVKDQGVCHHGRGCTAGPYDEFEAVTGPMATNETSRDTGWHVR